jgi:hypothetical protein
MSAQFLTRVLLQGIVVHACNSSNPSTQEMEVGGSWIQGQPGLNNENLSQSKNKNKKNYWFTG